MLTTKECLVQSLEAHHVIGLLTHFKLLQKMKNDCDNEVYFMPCLLNESEDVITTSYQAVNSHQIPSLLVHFKGRFRNLFCTNCHSHNKF